MCFKYIYRLKKHYDSYEPTLKALRHKYEVSDRRGYHLGDSGTNMRWMIKGVIESSVNKQDFLSGHPLMTSSKKVGFFYLPQPLGTQLPSWSYPLIIVGSKHPDFSLITPPHSVTLFAGTYCYWIKQSVKF